MKIFHEILQNTQASLFESNYFARTNRSEYQVIKQVGAEITKCFVNEFSRFLKKNISAFALLGSGHNSADVIATLIELKKEYPNLQTTLLVPPR